MRRGRGQRVIRRGTAGLNRPPCVAVSGGRRGLELDGGGRARRRAGDDCFFRAIAGARRIEFGDALS
ncbi:hypothetical protein BOC42_05585 [Burkholderia pseudomallei]|nr:hypothetical protein BOC37_28070 [Burkholderia pseudomallei]ARK86917.1 hypothetical protein BOC42_05585 [Burkholderia pseudomallei]ARL85187.1 hypothetical protein BOC57_02280 [Burkholderia pseudomallei]